MGNFYSQENTTPSFVAKSEYDTYVSTTPRVLDLNTVLDNPTLTQKLLTALANDSQKRFVGNQGPAGSTGPKGDTGQQGVKGDTGPQGLQGAKGDTGTTPDLSIYAKSNQDARFNNLYYNSQLNLTTTDGTQFINNRDKDDFAILTTKAGVSGGSHLNINPVFGGNVRIGYNPNDYWPGADPKDTNVPSSRLAVKGDINASGNLIGNGIKIGTNNSKICRASLTFNAYNGGTTNSNLTTLSSNGLSISRVNTAIFQINFTGDKPSDTNYIVTSFGIYNQPPWSGANMYGSSYNKTTNGFNLLISTRNTDNTEMKSDGTGFMDVCVFW
jgi:hypothetical protein